MPEQERSHKYRSIRVGGMTLAPSLASLPKKVAPQECLGRQTALRRRSRRRTGTVVLAVGLSVCRFLSIAPFRVRFADPPSAGTGRVLPRR